MLILEIAKNCLNIVKICSTDLTAYITRVHKNRGGIIQFTDVCISDWLKVSGLYEEMPYFCGNPVIRISADRLTKTQYSVH